MWIPKTKVSRSHKNEKTLDSWINKKKQSNRKKMRKQFTEDEMQMTVKYIKMPNLIMGNASKTNKIVFFKHRTSRN